MDYRAVELVKSYPLGSEQVTALKGVSLSLKEGEFTAIMGPSGSGKSTLLHILGGLDRPTKGEIYFDQRPMHSLTESRLAQLRRRRFGFIFQFFNLLPTLNAFENVALPLLLDGKSMSQVKDRSIQLLKQLGLEHRIDHYPAQLSGGEMQRVAIARALVSRPGVVFADEPTGNLDSKTGALILGILKDLVSKENLTLVMVTHDQNAAEYASRLIRLRDGLIESDTRSVKSP